jgi:hypothetical protein
VTTKTTLVSREVAIQSWLRPALTPVRANRDYEKFARTIEDLDRLVIVCHLEDLATEFGLEQLSESHPDAGAKDQARRAEYAVRALRVNLLKMTLGNLSFREFSTMIAASDLLSDFCRARRIDGISGISKSELGRMLHFFTEEQVRFFHATITEVTGNADHCGQAGLKEPVDTSVCLIDSTCLEANIHWPVDWILLKDVAGTLLKATILIRQAGLLRRMPQGPKAFTGQMNRLCIEMTHTKRRKDGQRARKKVLRRMKALLRTIGGHALRHRDLLEKHWERTDYSERQKERIVARIDSMLEALPKVIRQAHERIIGKRQVANAEKILSVHERDVHVIVRGKAGKDVEFGNTLTLCESAHGYILDWKLYSDRAPSESLQLAESLERQQRLQMEMAIEMVCTDRGFASKKTSRLLKAENIYDATCPRDPQELKERMKESLFAHLQKRRGSTEGRIAILKQRHGGRLREKGIQRRNVVLGWSVLAHNLWLISRMLAQQDEKAKAA